MTINVASAVASIEKSLREATNYFESGMYGGEVAEDDDYAISAYYMERAMIELLVLAEHLSLPTTVAMVSMHLDEARRQGFTESKMGSEQPYLVWSERVRMFVDGISSVHGLGETAQSEVKDPSKSSSARYMLFAISLCSPTCRRKSLMFMIDLRQS